MSSFVSVIMPTHNKAAYLERTLTGFLLQTYPDFELVIVDDGSSDATADVVKAFAEVLQIQFVQQEQGGRSAARNAALDVARGRVLVFNDDDRIPTPGFIEGHLARLEGPDDRISVGRKLEVLSIYDADIRLETDSRFLEFLERNPTFAEGLKETGQHAFLDPEELLEDFTVAIERCRYGLSADQYQNIYDRFSQDLSDFHLGWALCTTGNLALRLRDGIPPLRFDTDFKGWGMEDTDYAFRYTKAGYQVVYSPYAINFHQIHPRPVHQNGQFKRNLRYFCGKNVGPKSEEDSVHPGANIMALYHRFYQGDYDLIAINEIIRELSSSEPSLHLQDYLSLVRRRAGFRFWPRAKPSEES